MASPILEVKDLYTAFVTREGVVNAVNGVSLTLDEDAVLAVVGESGAGKTVTALSILQLLPFPGQVVSGSVRYNGMELLNLSAEQMRPIRGKEISLIFQDAAAALNPVIPIGKQVEEIILEHTRMGKRQARSRSIDLLTQMGIPDPGRMMDRYPFQLSGGMAQRVMLAIGVAMNPRVLIADEPTSNLDVTLQAEILQRLRQMRHENHSSIMLITHDLGVVAQMADTVAVMYGGMIVEHAEARALFARAGPPLHLGAISGTAQARYHGALAIAHARNAPEDDRPARPVSISPQVPEGDEPVPHRAATQAATGRRRASRGML